MRKAIYSERPKVPDFVYELIFEAEAAKDASEQMEYERHSDDFATPCEKGECSSCRQCGNVAKVTATTMTEMAMPDIWAFESPELRDEYAEALNTEIYEVLAVEFIEDPDLAEYMAGIMKAQERAEEMAEERDEEIAPDVEDKPLLDCSAVPDEVPEGLKIEDIFEAVDANNSG